MDSSPEPQPKRPAPKRKDKSKKTSKRSAKKVPSDEEENPISDEDLDYERDLQPAPKVVCAFMSYTMCMHDTG